MVRENERMFDIDDPAPRRSRLSRRDAPSPEAQAGVETARRNAAGDEPFAGMTPPTNRRGAARGNRDVPCTGGAQAGAARGNRDVPYSDGAQTGAARGNRDVPYSDGAQAGAARGSRDVPYAGGSRDAESLLDDAAIPFAHDDAPTMAPFERGRGKRRRGVQPDTSEAVEAMRRAKEGGRRRGAPVDIPDAAQPDGNAHGVRTAASPDAAGFSASTDAARDGASASGRGRFSASGDAGFSASTDARDGASVSGRGRSAASGAAGFSASTDAARDGASASGRGRFSASGDAGFSASTDAARDGASASAAGRSVSAAQGRAPASGAVAGGARGEDLRVAAGDLSIEPDVCDVIEADEPPFDVPKAPRKPGKLRRPAPVPEEDEEAYNYPPIDLLAESDGVTENHRDADMEKARLLEETLQQFGISSTLTGIAHGPAVTRFELAPAPGVKVSRITSLADDIAMHLAAMSVRIEAPIPGKAAVGVEIPNEKVETVRLRDVLESAEARKSTSKIAVGLGKDNSGRYIVADIAKMPHVLIAGQTGSGKSVCINSIITSILYRAAPDEVRLILIDPKVVELSIYNDIPHLVCPVVTDCKKAASALEWAVAEMLKRYKRFAERGVRDIKGYNKALIAGEKPMPQMVIIIDELADLMMVAPGDVEDSICRLAQLARAAGMHLVIATQRPSVNVVTGIIKANIPTRIAFSVASQVDSRTMIDHGGAEKLLGNGDMLFVPSGINKPMRVQGAWVSDEEVHAIVDYIKSRSGGATYDEDMIEQMENAARTDAEREDAAEEYDPRLPEAVEIVVEAGQASVSMLQRRMRVGYARAGRLIDEMQRRGIVSEADGAKPRTVLISREEMNALFEDEV